MSEWNPLSTSPRDGTKFLTYQDRLNGGFDVKMAWWSNDDLMGWGWSYAPWHMPTHWMPLPNLPIQKPKGEAE